MTIEKWLPVTGYSGMYEVSNLGRVRSIDRMITRSTGAIENHKGRVMKQHKAGLGYLFVSLFKKGKRKMIYVHRLVASEFLERNDKSHVNHKDFNKTNNELSNLEWVTAKENTHHYLMASPGMAAKDASEKILSSYAEKLASKPHRASHQKQKKCVLCGSVFYPPKKHRADQKTCSRKCGGILSGISRRKPNSTRSAKYTATVTVLPSVTEALGGELIDLAEQGKP